MPGGFARIGEHSDPRASVMGEGNWSADVVVHGPDPVAPVSLLPPRDSIHVRRNPGTLPSRVADNFFWLGRYLERGEALLGVIRVMLGNSIDADAGGAGAAATAGSGAGTVCSSASTRTCARAKPAQSASNARARLMPSPASRPTRPRSAGAASGAAPAPPARTGAGAG